MVEVVLVLGLGRHEKIGLGRHPGFGRRPAPPLCLTEFFGASGLTLGIQGFALRFGRLGFGWFVVLSHVREQIQ